MNLVYYYWNFKCLVNLSITKWWQCRKISSIWRKVWENNRKLSSPAQKFHSIIVPELRVNEAMSGFTYPYTAFYGSQTSVVWLQSSYQNRFISKSVISMQVVMKTQMKLVKQLWNLKITLKILLLCIISTLLTPSAAILTFDKQLRNETPLWVDCTWLLICRWNEQTADDDQWTNIVSKNESKSCEREKVQRQPWKSPIHPVVF